MSAPQDKRRQRYSVTSSPLTQLFVLALAVRLLFVALFPGVNYYGGITNEYLNVTKSLLGGHGLSAFVDIAPYNSGLTHFSYMPFVCRPIGYVLFLSLISLFTGIAPVAYQIAQAIITSFSVVLVYRLSHEIFRRTHNVERIARGAALLAAVWPNQARFEIALLPDGFTTLIMLGLVLALTKYIRTLNSRHLYIAGGILALSIFLRPDLVLFPLFFLGAGIFLLPKVEALKSTAILIAMLGIAVGINTWKNYEISGEIVPLNLGSGTTMYEGISQFGDTLGTTYADERLSHLKFNSKELFYPNGVENDRKVWREAIDTIKHHPLFYATVVARRVPLMFTVRGLYFSDTASLMNSNNDLAKRFPSKYIAMIREHPIEATVRFLSPLLGWLLVIFGFYGIWRALKSGHREHSMLVLTLVYFISTHLITNVEPRYFYPAVPLLYGYVAYVIAERRTPANSD